MKDILILIALTLIGYVIGLLVGLNPIEQEGFGIIASLALAIGLYTAVAGIDLSALGKYRKTALTIITAGVPLQIIVTGAVMYLIYPHPISFLLAVAIDQIDPISVSTLLNNKLGMSKAAKSLLNVWASFDDPMTVLFGFTILLPLVAGVSVGEIGGLVLSLFANILPAIVVFLVWKKDKLPGRYFQVGLLLASIGFTVLTQSFLYIALLGLMVRPFNEIKLSRLTTVIYYAILLVVGMSLPAYGIDMRLGIILAIVEFFIVQPLSAILMVRGTTNDIFRLAFAQQNGLTTILMGLTFQVLGFNVLPILLPAIIVINLLNLSINGYYNYREKQGLIITQADPRLMAESEGKLSYN